MHTTYEIRSKGGRTVMATDTLERARERLRTHGKTVPGLRLFEVVRTEKEIAL